MMAMDERQCAYPGCTQSFPVSRFQGARRYCDACRIRIVRQHAQTRDMKRTHRLQQARATTCECGAPFIPVGRQSRCDACRFAPSPNPLRKLKESDIPTIRARYQAGETAGKIARDYGMARSTIYAIVDWQTWRHVS